jgi:hypothetical protein
VDNQIVADVTSDHPEIVVRGGGRCQLRETETRGVFIGKCRIVGRQLKARGNITARIGDLNLTALTWVVVEERPPIGGVRLRFEPVEEDFGSLRYKWDEKEPYLLKIGAKHPSIRRYLGDPTGQEYPGIDSPLYHAVLAEVIAEALAFSILEKRFKREGEDGKLDYYATDAYYHKYFSKYLAITHKNLVAESIVAPV